MASQGTVVQEGAGVPAAVALAIPGTGGIVQKLTSDKLEGLGLHLLIFVRHLGY